MRDSYQGAGDFDITKTPNMQTSVNPPVIPDEYKTIRFYVEYLMFSRIEWSRLQVTFRDLDDAVEYIEQEFSPRYPDYHMRVAREEKITTTTFVYNSKTYGASP